jgi:hypothetical protein
MCEVYRAYGETCKPLGALEEEAMPEPSSLNQGQRELKFRRKPACLLSCVYTFGSESIWRCRRRGRSISVVCVP